MASSEKEKTLKSTAAVGGGQIIIILAGILKTKVAALLLGPAGIGVVGVLTMIVDLIRNISSLGLPLSGVREISIAENTDDSTKIEFTLGIFKKWMILAAFIGLVSCIVLGFPLSQYLFGNLSYGYGIMALGIAVFFGSLSAGILSVFQGKRKIGLMVKANMFSTLTGVIFTIVLYLVFREAAIIPAFIISAFIVFIVNYWFFKKLNVGRLPSISYRESFPYAKEMISVGFFTIIVVVFDNVMGLALRSFITTRLGEDGLGLFTAATTVAGMYLTVVLSSLSSDYLPKLASITSNKELCAAVNVQLNVVLLLASPIIIGMVGYSDVVLRILYSTKFLAADEVLRWQILGDFIKIISWPCGYVLLARGMGKLYTFYSLSYTVLYVIFILVFWKMLGFQIVGISFFISQACAAVFIYLWMYKKNNIYINRENCKIILIMGGVLLASFISKSQIKSPLIAYSLNFVFLAISIIYSFRNLNADIAIVSKIKSGLNKILKYKNKN